MHICSKFKFVTLLHNIVWILRSLRRQINIFGGGIAGTKNSNFSTLCCDEKCEKSKTKSTFVG